MTRVVSNFDQVAKATSLGVKRGVKLGVGELLLESGARADGLVPFDTGTLSRSQSQRVTDVGQTITGEIAYGGPAAPYALVQHEDATLSHPPKSKGGSPVAAGQGRGPKYLEFPSRQIGKRAEAIIAKAVATTRGLR